jgi:uncharacterized iron-regulated membrane protein
VRKLLLRIHLWLGVAAGLFLVVLGLTGSIIAFEGDIDHWLHPSRWYVHNSAAPMSEGALVAAVEPRVAPAHIGAIEIPRQPNLAQRMSLNDGTSVTVNPYTGEILGRVKRPTRTDRVLGQIHQLHLRLAPNPQQSAWAPAGKVIVSYAGLILCILAPTGLVLWLRTKRGSVKWQKASWFRRCFDLHLAIGIWAGVFLFVAGFTGILIGFESGEKAIFALTHSERPKFGPSAKSKSVPAGTQRIGVDRAMSIARAALPSGAVDTIVLPTSPNSVYGVIVRVPEETSGSAHSNTLIDQYTGEVLVSHNFLTDSQGYRWIRFNRSIHTGDFGGLAGHIVMSITSLLLVAMVVTGFVIWLKKLAV